MKTDYEKLRLSLRYFLLGKEFYKAAEALEFAGEYHVGFRKDGTTPELQHQVEITHYLRTLINSLLFPEETLTAALLHDITEDYGIKHQAIADQFSNQIGDAVYLLDKNGKTTDSYYAGIGQNPIASIVKGGDRMHNIQSMISVFTIEKQNKYMQEVEDHFLPMLKIARRKFVKQESAYENIKHVLLSQLELLRARV